MIDSLIRIGDPVVNQFTVEVAKWQAIGEVGCAIVITLVSAAVIFGLVYLLSDKD